MAGPEESAVTSNISVIRDESFSTRLCSTCAETFIPKLRTMIPTKSSQLYRRFLEKIGNLTNSISNEDCCDICKFLVEVTQLYLSNKSVPFSRASDNSQCDIYSIRARSPWFEALGLITPSHPNVWPCPSVWFDISYKGHDVTFIDHTSEICVSLERKSLSDQLFQLPHGQISPRTRSLYHAFTGSVEFDVIHIWLQKCKHEHSMCNVENVVPMFETLVINVQKRCIVRLGEGERFVALSYVWGENASERQQLVNTSLQHAREDQKFKEVVELPSILPQTIEDALTVVARLGENYLWVDLFCIDQLNEVEKRHQMEAMDLIFASAWLTIVCVDGPHADYGLPGISRSMSRTKQPRVMTSIGCMTATYVSPKPRQTSVWDTRAWTLQERLLSQRCLFFSDTHYYMSCKEEKFHDLISISTKETKLCLEKYSHLNEEVSNLSLDNTEWDLVSYMSLISAFTMRKISNEDDVYNACRGALKKITAMTGVEFHYGLPRPRDQMLAALLWEPHHENILHRRLGFPSWSWLGWIGRAQWPLWLRKDLTLLKEFLRLDAQTMSGNEAEFQRLNGCLKADIVHDIAMTAPIIQMRTTCRVCSLKRIRRHGESYVALGSNIKQIAVGDLWLCVNDDNGETVDEVVDPYIPGPRNESMFQLNPLDSNELLMQKCKACLLFVKYIPHIWLATGPALHFVSALVTLQDKHGSYIRLASILMPIDEWLNGDLCEKTITLI